MVDDPSSKNHAVQELGVQPDMVEPLRGVELAKGLFSSDGWLDRRRPIGAYVFAVLGKEALQVASVVRVKLALHDGFGIQLCRSCLQIAQTVNSFAVIMYLKLSGSRLSTRPAAVSAC